MGLWYLIANIPTFIEKVAHNAIESYAPDADGTIDTTFTFNQGAFNGAPKRYNRCGFVVERTNNAIWGMRFIWPAEYVFSYVDAAYTESIIVCSGRDYVWIVARTPTMSAKRYDALLAKVRQCGYGVEKVQKVLPDPEVVTAAALQILAIWPASSAAAKPDGRRRPSGRAIAS